MLRVLIVGCGNIAGGFDEGRPEDRPRTHAGAYRSHGGFEIAGCVEPDGEVRAAFMTHWEVATGAASIDEWRGEADLMSICSPTAVHEANLQSALALKPRLIFCEKPLTPSVEASEAVVASCDAAGVLLAVNHTRRWAPDVVRLRDELAAGEWGALRSVTGFYSKGVLNNGTHMVDLLRYLLGGKLSLVAASSGTVDHWPDDPSVSALLETEAGVPVHLVAGHSGDYSRFELELQLEGGVVAMEEGGFRWRVRRPIDSPHFEGYSTLSVGETVSGSYREAMAAAVDNIYEALTSSAPLASTGRTALEAQRLCAAIAEAAQARRRTDS